MTIARKLLPEFDEEFATTRKFLALVPDDKLTWKPHEKSMELGRLAWHISDFPEWCRETINQDTLSMTPEDGAKAAHEWEGKKRADMLARFDRDLPEARAALANAGDDALARPWKMEWAGQTIIDSPREEVLRKWALNHMIHHRAQLGVYLRLNNIPIPGSYGPSADETGG
ncbi:MAG TPA: DinB family protein [Bryobacteraceae bacterium]|nr:DinB family protein [Bryobacteraceae bacterium]